MKKLLRFNEYCEYFDGVKTNKQLKEIDALRNEKLTEEPKPEDFDQKESDEKSNLSSKELN